MIIYIIENKINNKLYVGLTTRSLQERWKEHQIASSNPNNHIRPIYRAINKYGINNFEIKEIDSAKTFSELSEKEIYWIDKLQTFKKGYNGTLGGEGTLGKTHSIHTRNKIKEKIKQYYENPENRKKASYKTKQYFDAHPEAKLKLSILGKEQASRGFSLEHRQKISNANKGRKKPDGFGEKISKAWKDGKNKPHPCPDHIKKQKQENWIKNNPMNDPEKRKLVSLSKLGKKRVYREDGTFYMVLPSKENNG